MGWKLGATTLDNLTQLHSTLESVFLRLHYMMIVPNKIPSYSSPKVIQIVPSPGRRVQQETQWCREGQTQGAPLVSLAGEDGLMAGETPETCQVERREGPLKRLL